jgi:cytidylate kinase
VYAREHGLLDTPGWKRFKRIAKREKVLRRAVNQAKIRSFNTAPRFKYGYEIPRNYEHAQFLDSVMVTPSGKTLINWSLTSWLNTTPFVIWDHPVVPHHLQDTRRSACT